jgi:hypothetical protein
MKKLIFIIVPLLLFSCAHRNRNRMHIEHKHAPIVRSGILKLGIHKQAFIDTWGSSNRAYTATSEEFMSGRVLGSGGNFYKGKKTLETLEVWKYEKIDTELVFDGNSLSAWKTDRTVDELRSFALTR